MEREKLGSRLGFILISAGCAIGLGNVYRFPIITGAYGGAAFVLIYIAFLVLLGLPVMMAELAVGRASQRSIATSFDVLEKPKQKWHLMKYAGVSGNYILMMFYCTISCWMVIYFIKYLTGSIMGTTDASELGNIFGATASNTSLNIVMTYVVIILCFGICALGLQKGVERITKVMMLVLLALLVGLAVYSCTLSNAAEGLKFYLVPSFKNMKDAGVAEVISAAMGQAFFTLSIGIGSVAIFGSYIGKERRLLSEAATIISLDTFVAITAGLIVFPACFTYNNGGGLDVGNANAGFLFTTLSSIFNQMPGGRIVGALFFLFMMFAAFSTVIAVFENIVSFWLELTNLKRWTICLINIGIMMVLVLPAIFSNSIWADIKLFDLGFMDLEDTIVSKWLLPLGSLVYVAFCTYRFGWGSKNFLKEVNTGKGPKYPAFMVPYMKFVLPLVILVVFALSFVKF